MSKVSVIIPARNEIYLQQTIDDILRNARGEVEVIPVLDGYWPDPMLRSDPRVRWIHHSVSHGMRAAINEGLGAATGEYILKSDAHCMMGEGWDEILKADCQEQDVVVPRRFALDAENWKIKEDKAPVDYHYLTYPLEKAGHIGLHGKYYWHERTKERAEILYDEEMSSQGSMYFMHKAYFERFGGLSEVGYGSFTQEFQELGMRTWMSGGRVMVNKKTWYAHLWKKERGYSLPSGEQSRGALWSCDFWINDRWHLKKYNFSRLIDKFNPPGWPADWRDCRRQIARAAREQEFKLAA
jgi:glycosyltransferase involved in cell wall biosynthesis